jgi:hypothetical protein
MVIHPSRPIPPTQSFVAHAAPYLDSDAIASPEGDYLVAFRFPLG